MHVPAVTRLDDGRILNIDTAQTLGTGLTSSVYAGTLDGRAVAVKCVTLSKLTARETEMLHREIPLLALVGTHRYIARYHGHASAPGYEFLVFDRYKVSLYEMTDAARPLSDRVVCRLAWQLATALHYLHHECNVVHGDLKLENVMLDADDNVRIIDFGFAEHVPAGRRLQRLAGSLHYVSPEMLDSSSNDGSFCGRSADAWALGVLIYTMTSRRMPFYVDHVRGKGQTRRSAETELMRRICKDPVPQLAPTYRVAGIVAGLLNRNVKERFDAQRVLATPALEQYAQAAD